MECGIVCFESRFLPLPITAGEGSKAGRNDKAEDGSPMTDVGDDGEIKKKKWNGFYEVVVCFFVGFFLVAV